MSAVPHAQALFDWLVDGAPGALGPDQVVFRLATGLVESGVPLARIVAFVRTLHPSIAGRRFRWLRGRDGVEIDEAPYAMFQRDEYLKSPIGRVFTTGQELRHRLDGAEPLYQDLEQLRRSGLTDYLVLPLRFIDGQVHAITYGTDAPGGFTDGHLDALRAVTRPLSRLAEILALRRTATNLLSAYLGHDVGARILGGQVQRGDCESIRCVIWFSDLRNFTLLSDRSESVEIIRVLNQVFDCQVPAVEKEGGEVLKFMGDGMLAIFPIDARHHPTEVCQASLRASEQAFAALAALNVERTARGDGSLDFGVSLHLGDVAYGNIGGAARLDFTCIGPAVNLAARIESLTGKLGKRMLLSEDFARTVPAPTRTVGAFELKGLERPVNVFELA